MAILRNPNHDPFFDPYDPGSELLLSARGQVDVHLEEQMYGSQGGGNHLRGTVPLNYNVVQRVTGTLLRQTAGDVNLSRMAVADMVKRLAAALAAHFEKEVTQQLLNATVAVRDPMMEAYAQQRQQMVHSLGAAGLNAKAIAGIKATMDMRSMYGYTITPPDQVVKVSVDAAEPKPKLPKYYASGIRVSDDDEEDE